MITEKRKEYLKKWRAENRDELRERKKEYYKNNIDKIREKALKRKAADPENLRNIDSKWRNANPERVKEISKVSYEKHRGKRLKCRREYYLKQKAARLEKKENPK